MKPSTVLLCLTPAVAFAQQQQQHHQQQHQPSSAVEPSPSVPNFTPPVPLPELQRQLEVRDGQISNVHIAAAEPTISADAARPLLGTTKSLQARSEGTLGQSPWIGMAIGLTCTALAAVMLG